MSHWRNHTSDVLSNINEDILTKACTDMNVSFDKSIKSIRNTWGNEKVDAGLKVDGHTVALGFNFITDEATGKTSLQLSGDFYNTGLNESIFIDRLAQAYMKYKAVEVFENKGWIINSIETVNEEIVIDARDGSM